MAFDILTFMMAKKGGGVSPEKLSEELNKKQNKLTAGDNITIENSVISSNQPTAVNPFTLSFGDDDYNGSAPKQITAEKIGAATEDFVNSSIATNTAFFRGTFDSVAKLPSTGVTNNDYAFIVVYERLDPSTVKQYDRYKYTTESNSWVYEYTLNNSSFTADEWATIQSGLKAADKKQIATNTSAIADLTANMPVSPEDVNAQPKSLIVEASFDGESITITDSRYASGGTVDYLQLYTDSMTAFNGGTDIVLRFSVGTDVVVDLKCNCLTDDSHTLLYEGHNMAAVIVVALSNYNRGDDEAKPVYVEIVKMYNIEPEDSMLYADDDSLTTAKAQKDYFQTKIDSSNKIPYSNISGTPALKTVATSGSYNDLSNKPTIPTVPSNLVLGYSGTTSTASALKIVTCTQAQYDSSSKASDTVYLING